VLSLISGVISKELGAYYLVGAFAVGLIASKFKKQIFKDDEESFFGSLSSFFNVFLPFYFFFAGLKIKVADLTLEPLTSALILFVIFVPLRIWIIRVSVKRIKHDIDRNSYNISLSLMPTLIFGLVIAGILKDRGILEQKYIFSLIIYTLLTSILPVIIASFKKATGDEQQTLDF
jgi:Kef-type K+ transport system membrane component KefB